MNRFLKKFFEYVKKDVKNITKDDVEDFFTEARKDKVSRIKQRAIDSLIEDLVEGNQAYIEQYSKFGLVRFSMIYRPN